MGWGEPLRSPPMDWREIFKKYVDIVGREEGVVFLYESDWTPEEWAAIQKADAETTEAP